MFLQFIFHVINLTYFCLVIFLFLQSSRYACQQLVHVFWLDNVVKRYIFHRKVCPSVRPSHSSFSALTLLVGSFDP